MTRGQKTGTQARVLAAAIRTWATTNPDPSPPCARLQIRQPPTWSYTSTTDLTHQQHTRLLTLLRNDLANHHPGHSTPERAAAVIHGLITETAAASHRHITTADLVQAAPRIGRDRTWIASHITHLIDQGLLQETRHPNQFRIA
ncbi:hypothetical protein ACWEGQ_00460 [Streptomyces seoulensis]